MQHVYQILTVVAFEQRHKSIWSVPGHSPLKFKQIFKIKDPLVLETFILLG